MASTFNQVRYAQNVDQLKFEATIIDETIAPSYFNSEVSNIVAYRFNNCSGLEYVEFTSAETIGDGAFQNCISLETAVFQAATSLGSDVFAGCTSLHEIRFDSLTPMPASFSTSTAWTSVNFGAITTLPNSRASNFGLFFSNVKTVLQSVYFNGVTSSIPSYYFSNFTALKTVEFQNASTDIGSYAFISCHNLETISVPNIQNNIGRNAFANCSKLTSINMPLASGTIGIQAFIRCINLSSINISNITILGSGCFEGCSSLTSIFFPAVTSMSSSRHFADCINLSYVNFEELGTLAGARTNNSNTVFLGATNIQELRFSRITTIQSYYFASYSNLKSIWFPCVGVISNHAFRYDIGLSRVDLPAVQTLGTYAFAGCTSLTTIKFMNLSRINGNTFNGCTNLQSLYLLGSSMTILSGGTNNFTNAGITANTGTIYVPASLLSTYKANNSWKTYSNRFSAYVFSSYTARLSPTTHPYNAYTVYALLETPDWNAEYIGFIPHGAVTTVLSTFGSWYQISNSSGITGWIQGELVLDLPPD